MSTQIVKLNLTKNKKKEWKEKGNHLCLRFRRSPWACPECVWQLRCRGQRHIPAKWLQTAGGGRRSERRRRRQCGRHCCRQRSEPQRRCLRWREGQQVCLETINFETCVKSFSYQTAIHVRKRAEVLAREVKMLNTQTRRVECIISSVWLNRVS